MTRQEEQNPTTQIEWRPPWTLRDLQVHRFSTFFCLFFFIAFGNGHQHLCLTVGVLFFCCLFFNLFLLMNERTHALSRNKKHQGVFEWPPHLFRPAMFSHMFSRFFYYVFSNVHLQLQCPTRPKSDQVRPKSRENTHIILYGHSKVIFKNNRRFRVGISLRNDC